MFTCENLLRGGSRKEQRFNGVHCSPCRWKSLKKEDNKRIHVEDQSRALQSSSKNVLLEERLSVDHRKLLGFNVSNKHQEKAHVDFQNKSSAVFKWDVGLLS